MRWLLIALIRFYQRCISPWLGPRCRYVPTCSAFFVEALQKKGLVLGSLAGARRILRCHPFSRGGFDPVK